MVALANVALTDTFDTWRIRTNQIIVKGNEDELTATVSFAKANTTNITADLAFNKANTANVLAFNTGTGANAFTSATIAGANTAVGTGANSYATTAVTSANSFTSATIAGANTAVGTGANSFTSATIAGANTAVGTGANSYATTVGTSANAFISSTIAGANTISIAAFAKANSALANTTGATFEGNLTVTGSVNVRSGIISTANNTVGSAGQALLSTGSGTFWGEISSIALTTQIFTSSGTWTRPTGCKFIKVTVVGSGGGGGSGIYYAFTVGCSPLSVPGVGGWGGQGGLSIRWLDVTTISSNTVTIGSGGAGSSSASAGSTGGTTSFGSYAQSTGGVGGSPAENNPGVLANGGRAAGGEGGTASLGDINVNGVSIPTSAIVVPVAPTSFSVPFNPPVSSHGFGKSADLVLNTTATAPTGHGMGGTPGYDSTGNRRTGSSGGNGLIIVEEFY